MLSHELVVATAALAWELPCSVVHPAGAPCCVCNADRTEEGYSNAPYYYLERLKIARAKLEADAAIAARFGAPILPRRGLIPPLFMPGKTWKDVARRLMLGAGAAAVSIAADDLTVLANDPAEPVTLSDYARAHLQVLNATISDEVHRAYFGTAPAGDADAQN